MKIALPCIAVVCLGLVSPLSAKDPPFRYAREILPPALQQEELLSITIDQQIFAATRDGFSDLRLRDASGKSLPYLLRKRQSTRSRSVRITWPAPQPAVRPRDDGSLEITVRFEIDDKRPNPTGLTIVSPLRNFEQRMRVFTSVGGEEWEPTGEETVLFDYSRYMEVRNDSVAFPETNRRFFRIVIDDVTLEQHSELVALTRRYHGEKEIERTERETVGRRSFRIDRIDFWRENSEERVIGDEKRAYPVTDHRVGEDRDNQRTIIEIDTQRTPLTALRLETRDRNFSRHAIVEAEKMTGAAKGWQRIGEGVLSRVDFRNLKRDELSLSFPETRREKYRIVIDNGDSPPLNVIGIQGEGNVYEALYLALPGGHVQLNYGAPDARPLNNDTAAIREVVRSGFHPSPASLGPEVPITSTSQPIRWSKRLQSPIAVGGVITILLLLLGRGLYKAAKRIEELPEREEE